MQRHPQQIIVLDDHLLSADIKAVRTWFRSGMAAASGWHAIICGLSLYGLWTVVGAYKGIFGLPSGGGEVATDATPLLGVGILCAAAIVCVLCMFILPRWELREAGEPALRHIARVRMAACAAAILMPPWVDPGLPLAALLVPLVAASACWRCEIETGGIDPAGFLGKLAVECVWAFVSFLWLVLWTSMWFHVAAFWFPEATADGEPFVMAAIVVAGCVVQSAMRHSDRRWPVAGLACVAVALCLANPGVPGLVGGTLYVMKAGGGHFDIEASVSGRPVCDMGALGRHYYVRAGDAGCTRERANRMVGMLRAMPEGERVSFLLAQRVPVGAVDR